MALRERLKRFPGIEPTTLVRRPTPGNPGETVISVEDYFSPPRAVLEGMDSIVNFAGLTRGPLLWQVNVEGTTRLAELAKACGIRQFVQLSSLSVYGPTPQIDHGTPERPVTDYGRSKLAADNALRAMASADFTITLLRAPIFYGRGAGAKLHILAKFMSVAHFLPVPPHRNRRSALHLNNLASAVLFAVRHGLSGVQFAADPEPLTLDAVAAVVARHKAGKVALPRLPSAVFWPLRHAAPGLYDSLYGDNLIRPDCCVDLTEFGATSLRDGLSDIMSR